MEEQILLQSTFSGGLSSGSKKGLAGSFRWGQGIDIYSDPDVLKISPKSTKDSGTTIVDLPLFSCTNTVNANIYFFGNAGKVYKRTSAGVWSVITTNTNAQGAGFFAGTNKIYFTDSNTEYILDPSNDSIAGGRSLNSANFHPVEAFLDKVFIGNGRELISTDASAINYDSATVGGGITVEYNYTIKCLKNIGDWLFIGCESSNSSNAKYYLWDGISEDYNYGKTLKGEDGINAVEVSDDGTVLILAGKQGHIYQLTGLDNTLTNLKTIPRIEKNKTIETYPQAICNYQGGIRFGLSTGTSETAERGIYSYRSSDKNYPKVLNLDYAISTETTTGTTLQIGCLLSANTNDLYIGWRDGSSYGVDKIDGSGVQPTAIFESLIHDAGEPFRVKHYSNFKITLAKALASGEVITLYYKADRGSWTSIGTIDYSVDGAVLFKRFKPDIKARELEIKLAFANSSTTAPEIDSILMLFNIDPLI